jgi:hypothetical protein
LRVRLPLRVDDGVLGTRGAAPQPLLQPRLRVLGERRRIEPGELVGEHGVDDGARRVESAVLEDRAEHGLERVGHDRRPLAPAAAALALAEAQHGAQAEAPREPGEALAAHQVRAQAREVALRHRRQAVEQRRGDHAVEPASPMN